jgi:hypothetical protein
MHRLTAPLLALTLAACFDSDEVPCTDIATETGDSGDLAELEPPPGPPDLPAGAGSLWHACDAGSCAPGLECYAPAAGYEICAPIIGQWVADASGCPATMTPPLKTGDTFIQPMGDLCVAVCTVYPGATTTFCDAAGSIVCVKGECGWPQ